MAAWSCRAWRSTRRRGNPRCRERQALLRTRVTGYWSLSPALPPCAEASGSRSLMCSHPSRSGVGWPGAPGFAPQPDRRRLRCPLAPLLLCPRHAHLDIDGQFPEMRGKRAREGRFDASLAVAEPRDARDPRLAGRVALFPAKHARSREDGRPPALGETRCVASAVTPVRAPTSPRGSRLASSRGGLVARRRPCFPRGACLAHGSAIGRKRQPDQECRNGDSAEARCRHPRARTPASQTTLLLRPAESVGGANHV